MYLKSKGINIRFVVMANFLPSGLEYHEKFDLKVNYRTENKITQVHGLTVREADSQTCTAGEGMDRQTYYADSQTNQ